MIAEHVRRLAGYVPGEQPKSRDVVKLNTNENAYPPSPRCAQALKDFEVEDLRRYCDPDCTRLREALAELNGTVPERIFVGNGSDEILALSARAFVENHQFIASLDPSYSLYKTLAAIRNVPWRGFDFAEIETADFSGGGLFILTNPNAPTGEWRCAEQIAGFTKRFPGVVIIDEAYADFSRDNCMKLATAPDNENVMVMRTFSKSFSLAGLRVGYCVGPVELIDAMVKVKDSYNVDGIAQKVALAAVEDIGWMRKNVNAIVTERELFKEQLQARGWTVVPSESNFVFARPPKSGDAERIFKKLREQSIFVRYFPGPKTGEYMRITIGTPEQMKILLSAIDGMKEKE